MHKQERQENIIIKNVADLARNILLFEVVNKYLNKLSSLDDSLIIINPTMINAELPNNANKL